MNGKRSLMCLALGLVAIAFAAAPSTGVVGLQIYGDEKANDEKVEVSAAQLQKLLDRVNELETRVAELERKRPQSVPAISYVPTQRAVTPPQTALKRVPQNWSPRTFNGVEYYIVPLGGESVSPSPTNP